MPRISLRGVVFEHGAHGPFPEPIDLDLEPGWTGVVGPNGVGKTTLLRLIAGELRCARGRVRIEGPTGVRFMHQSVEWTPAIERFAVDWSARAGQLRSRLELDPDHLARWSTLSPGERKRWQLAAALVDDPTVLLCDEPSNHLDAGARELLHRWLLEFGREYAGVGLIVSHDRELLDALCSATLFLAPGGRVELRPGGYSDAAAAREAERSHQRAEYELARRTERRLARQVQAARERQAATQRSRRVSSRKRDHRDHDASSSARKFRADHAAASAAADLRRSISAHARGQAAVASFDLDHDHAGELFVDWEPPRKSVLVSLTPPELAEFAPHPGTRLPGGRPLVIRRETRAHLAGANGAGKTSLLRAIQASAAASFGAARILWLAQELDDDARRGLLERVARLEPATRGRVLQIVAAAGGDVDALLATPSPSPGEARKLAIALGLATRVWLVLLDEPMNHLDLASRAAIERMLRAYPGALIVSGHEGLNLEAITAERWQL